MMNRRALLAGLTAGSATLVLAACGGSSSGSGASGANSSSDTGGAGSFPAKVTDAFGTVTVTSAERVVALGWGDNEVCYALGVQPVGVADWLAFGGKGVGPWAEDKVTTTPTMLGTQELDYEAVAALKPDLILDVKSSGDKDRYQRLTQIAPTVGIPKGAEQWTTLPKDQLAMIGAALGRKDQAAALQQELDDKFAEVTKAHPDWAKKTASVPTKMQDTWYAYLEGDGRADIISKFGFQQSEKIKALAPDEKTFFVTLSAEQLDQLDADLVVALAGTDEAAVKDDAQFQQIPAVAAGHDVIVSGDLSSAFSTATPLATEYLIEQLPPMIEKAIGA